MFAPLAIVSAERNSSDLLLVGVGLASLPMNFISTFFGVAFIGVLRKHLAGEPASLSEGIAFARTRLGPIIRWSLIATAVGLVIRALARIRGGAFAVRLASALIGVAWAIATLFVLPVLASSDHPGALAAARESGQIVRKRFGETVSGQTAIGVVFAFLFLPVVLIGVIGYTSFAGSPLFGALTLILAIFLGLVLIVVQSAVDGVFRVALYDYAVSGTVMHPFSSDDLANGIGPKRRFFRR